MSAAADLNTVELLDLYATRQRASKGARFTPYDWQSECFQMLGDKHVSTVLAGNRCGKTYSVSGTVAQVAMGDLFPWWEKRGYWTVPYAPRIAVCGVNGQTLRDIFQKELVGELMGDEFDGTGWIPKERIVGFNRSPHTRNGVTEVYVKHASGGVTRIDFRAYSQGHMVIAGQTYDLIAVDEEPEHDSLKFIGQCVVRTMTGGVKGDTGRVILSFTAEHGMTPLCDRLINNRPDNWGLINVAWSDCPHLTEDVIATLVESIPSYQLEMRRTGMPVFAEGVVFPVSEEVIMTDLHEDPRDWWKQLGAIDFGFAHKTAVGHLYYDPEIDMVLLARCLTYSERTPEYIGPDVLNLLPEGLPFAYPHDGDNTEKGSGDTIAELYRKRGLDMAHKFHNEDGTNYVEPGLQWMLERMRNGRLKVARSCTEWFREFRMYHRKNGKIVKADDDCIDMSRYGAIMVPRFGVSLRGSNNYSGAHYPELDF